MPPLNGRELAAAVHRFLLGAFITPHSAFVIRQLSLTGISPIEKPAALASAGIKE